MAVFLLSALEQSRERGFVGRHYVLEVASRLVEEVLEDCSWDDVGRCGSSSDHG